MDQNTQPPQKSNFNKIMNYDENDTFRYIKLGALNLFTTFILSHTIFYFYFSSIYYFSAFMTFFLLSATIFMATLYTSKTHTKIYKATKALNIAVSLINYLFIFTIVILIYTANFRYLNYLIYGKIRCTAVPKNDTPQFNTFISLIALIYTHFISLFTIKKKDYLYLKYFINFIILLGTFFIQFDFFDPFEGEVSLAICKWLLPFMFSLVKNIEFIIDVLLIDRKYKIFFYGFKRSLSDDFVFIGFVVVWVLLQAVEKYDFVFNINYRYK